MHDNIATGWHALTKGLLIPSNDKELIREILFLPGFKL